MHIPLAVIRNNQTLREASEKLIKFGLVEIIELHDMTSGRGRPPVATRITEAGILFYNDYITQFDTYSKYKERMSEPAPEWFMGEARAEEKNKTENEFQPTKPPEQESENSDEQQITEETDGEFQPWVDEEFNDAIEKANQRSAKWLEERKAKTKMSDSSDIVDGENLRDLFGWKKEQ